MVKFYDKFLPPLSEHEGRLCLIEFNHLKEKCFEIYDDKCFEIYDARGSSMGMYLHIYSF